MFYCVRVSYSDRPEETHDFTHANSALNFAETILAAPTVTAVEILESRVVVFRTK